MALKPEDAKKNEAVAAFIAELKHRREVAGVSQKGLAKVVEYTPSYVNKVERGTVVASRSFAESSDRELNAGRAHRPALEGDARGADRAVRRDGPAR